MNHRIMICSLILAGALVLAGCYTQMMTPQEFLQTRRSTSTVLVSDNSYSLNYNRSCVSCHTVTELNERADELEYYGIRSVHDGYSLSDRPWLGGGAVGGTVYVPPANPYWPGNPSTGTAWWVTGGGQGPTLVTRPRQDGATRDGSVIRDRPGTTATAPTPVSTPPSTPAGTGTAVSTTPAPAPVNSDGSRPRAGSGSVDANGRTRNDGTTRDDSENRPR